MNTRIIFKYFVSLLIIMVISVSPAFAQKNKGKSRSEMRKEMSEFHLKFLAQEIDLKEDQQKAFFDTYKAMMDERGKVFHETRNLEKRLKAGNASEQEYESVTNALTSAKEKDAAIEKKYDDKLGKILSPKQLYQLKEAEKKWRAKMQQMRFTHRHDRKKANR